MEILNRIGARTLNLRPARVVSQKTVNSAVQCTGVGLHSGANVTITLKPAPADTGILFVRTDLGDEASVLARWDNVVDTRMCTVLGNDDGVTVGTVEHLLAAFAGTGVDNAIVELDGPEVPVMDGSAAPFVFLIECAGIAEQPAPKRAIRVLEPIEVRNGTWSATLEPGDGFSVDVEIAFEAAAVSRQSIVLDLAEGTFKRELARARTFGFLHEVEQLKAAGLARGGSLDNAVVVSGDRVLNEGGLRYADEFVRHKALDAIGDLFLAGAPIIGHFQGVCSGHDANNRLLKALFAKTDAWAWDLLRVRDARPRVVRTRTAPEYREAAVGP